MTPEELRNLEEKIRRIDLWIFGDPTDETQPGARVELILLKKDMKEIKRMLWALIGMLLTVVGGSALYFLTVFMPKVINHVGN